MNEVKDNIDIFQLLTTLWDNKWVIKIYSFITTTLIFSFNSTREAKFESSMFY